MSGNVPLAVAVIFAFANPQVDGVNEAVTVGGGAFVTVAVICVVQLFASVTVNEYDPAATFSMFCVVAPLFH